MFAAAFFLAFHLQDHHTRIGSGLPKGFILTGVTRDDVRFQSFQARHFP